MEVGADKDQAVNSGATPLFIAAQNGHLDVVRHLLDVGADKDQAQSEGGTPRCLIFVSTNFHQMTNNIKVAVMSCNEQSERPS